MSVKTRSNFPSEWMSVCAFATVLADTISCPARSKIVSAEMRTGVSSSTIRMRVIRSPLKVDVFNSYGPKGFKGIIRDLTHPPIATDALHSSKIGGVCPFGSEADIPQFSRHVRSPPNSGHHLRASGSVSMSKPPDRPLHL